MQENNIPIDKIGYCYMMRSIIKREIKKNIGINLINPNNTIVNLCMSKKID